MIVLFMYQVVDNSDVVLEVLDARDPLGCRCFKVNFTLFGSTGNSGDINAASRVCRYARIHSHQSCSDYLVQEILKSALK